MADEATTAHLKAVVQPVKLGSQIELSQATYAVNQCFERWGLPKKIKIDNGFPFVNPNWMSIPSKSKLWWIGLGIEVIQNTPAVPQENGVVECLQGICSRWVHPTNINTKEELQIALDDISNFQRNHYQIPKHKNKTRIDLHPELELNPRKYNPALFDIELVYQYLATQVWERRIKEIGTVHFFGQEIRVSRKVGGQDTFITFSLLSKQWIFRSRCGDYLGSSAVAVPTEKEIKDFAIMSKN
jgi:hypothetical protein